MVRTSSPKLWAAPDRISVARTVHRGQEHKAQPNFRRIRSSVAKRPDEFRFGHRLPALLLYRTRSRGRSSDWSEKALVIRQPISVAEIRESSAGELAGILMAD